MLNLKDGDQVLRSVAEGSRFSLPNGDVVSPAYAGWASGSYSLVEAPDTPDIAISPTKDAQELSRRNAYIHESDPLFFMSQRGEATIEEWQAKVAEIKARYPYPAE